MVNVISATRSAGDRRGLGREPLVAPLKLQGGMNSRLYGMRIIYD
jgi:hypothetical protein